MIDPFDPQSEYDPPKTKSRYLKFEKDVNTKFMPLASAVTGFEYWNLEGKPVRLAVAPDGTPDDIRRDTEGTPESIKHFWAFPVFDYADKTVKMLEITQQTIQAPILAYARNPDWGSPVQRYSFTVKRTGDKLTTEYTVMANPGGEFPAEIGKAWEEAQKAGFDINRLFDGQDPFSPEEKKGDSN